MSTAQLKGRTSPSHEEPDGSRLQYRLPHHPDATEHERAAAIDLLADHEGREESEQKARNRELKATLERASAKVREEIGAKNYLAWQLFKQDLRTEAANLTRSPGKGMTIEAVRTLMTERMAAKLAQFGAEPGKIKAIYRSFLKSAPQLHYAKSNGQLEFRDGDISFEPVVEAGPSVFVPPYAGFQSGVGHGLIREFSAGRTQLLDVNAGHVGNILTLDCTDASDFSCGSTTADTQIVFFFRAPATGLVEVSLIANCGEARHILQVRDEWGVSDCSATQLNFLMMHILHGNVRDPSFALTSRLDHDSDVSTFRDEQHILPGQQVRARLVSDGPVPAGAGMFIRAGSRSQDGVITNDMKVHSRTSFSWFLRRIEVRII